MSKKIFCALLILALALPACADDLPVSLDYRAMMPAIRNQNPWGTCWAFATIGAAEGNYLMQVSKDVAANFRGMSSNDLDLSELHLAWYVYAKPNKQASNYSFSITTSDVFKKLITSPDTAQILNEGGNLKMALAFLARGVGYGPVSEDSLPYTEVRSKDDTAALRKFQASMDQQLPGDYMTVMRVKDSYYFDEADLKTEAYQKILKQLIKEHGAAAVRYVDSDKGHSEENRSYYANSKAIENDEEAAGHIVVAVGWDDSFDQYSFNNFEGGGEGGGTPNGNGAWLIRNSWGTTPRDHDNGYFWMSYSQPIIALVLVMESKDVNQDEITFDYAPLGWIDEWGEQDQTDGWGANVYGVKGGAVKLDRVGFYTTSHDAEVKIYIKSYSSAPTSADLESGDLVFSGTIPYAGYHTISPDHAITVASGDYFSVMTYVKNKGTDVRPIAIEMASKGYTDYSVTYDGESYFSLDGSTWWDGTSYKTPYSATIKVFASATTTTDKPDFDRPTGTIDGLPVVDIPEATVAEEYINAVNPETGTYSGRKIVQYVVDNSGDRLPQSSDVEVDLVYIQALFDEYDDETSSQGDKEPTKDPVALYPTGYRPTAFFYGYDEEYGDMHFPVYSGLITVEAEGKITIDVDNFLNASGDKVNVPNGYFDVLYVYASGDAEVETSAEEEEDEYNFDGKVFGWLRTINVTSNDPTPTPSPTPDSGDSGTNILSSSSGGCSLGLGGLLGLALAAVVFKKKR